MTDRLDRILARLDLLIDWERRDRSAGMRVDRGPMLALMAALGEPQRALTSVHVTGSKGKGSVAALVEQGALAAGLRTGLYTSPHVETIEERLRLCGDPIGREPLAAALERALRAKEDCLDPRAARASWFDVLTAAAFLALRDAGVDLAAIEVGLGGRLDSTNVLRPGVCVITTIELEHTAVLGPTRERIAAEKAGILWPGCELITGLAPADPAGKVIADRARALGVPVEHLPPAPGEPLLAQNRRLAGAALAALGRRGLRDAGGARLRAEWVQSAHPRLPGRLERFSVGGIPLVLDGAHTPGSLAAVLAELGRDPSLPGRPCVVFGAGRDKDHTALFSLLRGVAERVFCSSVGQGLASPSTELASKAAEVGLDTETVSDPRVAIQRALAAASGRWVLVTGSLHLVGAVRRHLRTLDP